MEQQEKTLYKQVKQYCFASFISKEYSWIEQIPIQSLIIYRVRSKPCISGWIFQKVLAEIVHKGLILSQKALISNRRNFSLFAPTSMRFPSKDSKSKDLSF